MKDFDEWSKKKKSLHNTGHNTLVFNERDIWWCSIGVNIGEEQDSGNELFERPVLIIKKFNNKICWVLPISSKIKDNTYYHKIEYQSRLSSIILSQLRLVSVRRFRRFVRKISPNQFKIIKQKLIDLLE